MKTLGTEQFDVYLRRYSIHYETDLEALLTKYLNIFRHSRRLPTLSPVMRSYPGRVS